jgi:hypothetical protein
VTQALAQFVLDHDGTIIARWDTFKGEVVYEQEQHRSAGSQSVEKQHDATPAGRPL